MTRPGEGPRRIFRLPPSESTLSRDIDDEIAFHVDARAAELIADGMAPEEARLRAEREFGDVASARSELASIDRVTLRRERRAAWWDAAWYDVRLAMRGMRRNRAFTLAVVLTMALGIGVNATMFGIADRLLLSAPAHVVAADDVARVLYRTRTRENPDPPLVAVMAYPDYLVLRDLPLFSDVAAYTPPVSVLLGEGESASEVQLMRATASYFPTLGVQPARGRLFTEAEDSPPAGERVLVISHGLWQDRYGGADVLGQTVRVGPDTYRIIGVAPRGFNGLDLETVHAWAPISTQGAAMGDEWATSRAGHWLRVFARLAPGAQPAVVAQQASAAFEAANEFRLAEGSTVSMTLGSAIAARAPAVGDGAPQRTGRIALWLLGVSALVLVTACANVANLMLARGMRRRREIAVRVALGVTRWRLAAQVLTETVLITLTGTALGVLFAHWTTGIAGRLLLPDVAWDRSIGDVRVLGFAAALALVCALLAGLLPALHATRAGSHGTLELAVRGTYRRSVARSGLVALQATLSVLLLVGAGLFVRSFDRISDVPLGFEPDRVLMFEWRRAGLDWNTARVHRLYDEALARVSTLPQVEAAAITTTAPMYGRSWGSILVPGMDSVPGPASDEDGPFYASVSPDYFAATGARIVSGRPFTDADVRGGPPVAIITERTAQLLWPGGDALGRCIIHEYEDGQPCREVVGIAEDTRYREVLAEPSMMYYLPAAQLPGWSMRVLLVRPGGDAAAAATAVRTAMAAVEPGLPPVQMRRLSERVDPQLQPWRIGAVLFTSFGVLALILSGLGLYGVVTYDVAQRRRELGVRVALGAGARRVMRMVIGDAVGIIALGLILGLAVAGFAAGYIEPLLFEVSPRDPPVLLGAAALLVIIAVAAAALPAWRAAHVHPTEALRED